MEEELNIANILKDKPKGTKLYADAFGKLILGRIDEVDTIYTKSETFGFYSFYSNGKYTKEGEPVLVPSKEMRDWRKFDWKKGDVLVSKDNVHIIFEKFEDDAYTRFKGKHYLWKECDEEDYAKEETYMLTSVFEKANDDAAQTYIKTIEGKLGGKLNRETLEVEKPHPEFKDGDIITITPQIGNNLIFIFRAKDVEKYYCHAYLDGNIAIVNDDSCCQKYFCTARPSTEEEQKQLFEALAKKGKAWDAEKKAIVDLKPKWTPKPFDKIVAFEEMSKEWVCDMFSHYSKNYEDKEVIVTLGGCTYFKALPFNEETAKLIGTTKDVEE